MAKYMVRQPKPPSQRWRTFLNNHVKDLVSTDFFVVPTLSFRALFVFVASGSSSASGTKCTRGGAQTQPNPLPFGTLGHIGNDSSSKGQCTNRKYEFPPGPCPSVGAIEFLVSTPVHPLALHVRMREEASNGERFTEPRMSVVIARL